MSGFIDFPSHLDANNEAFLEIIKENIAQSGGKISFADYMELALYHQPYGFYNAQSYQQHYITAPHLSPLFAKCLAQQLRSLFQFFPQKTVLEFGAGSGRLASDLIENLALSGDLPQQYFILEKSLSLRTEQQNLIKKRSPEHLPRFKWIEKIPQNFHGIVIANEVLDALPVHCFAVQGNKIYERYVSFQQKSLTWVQQEASARMQSAVQDLKQDYGLPDHYQSEINFAISDFIGEMAQSLSKAIVLFFDYGYGRAEYYHPQRNQGTLTCFYKHTVHSDPFYLPGAQDITAHVDFTTVAESACTNGLDVLAYTSQSAFLLANDLVAFTQETERDLTVAAQVSLHTGIKQLTLPTEMGERIKVMVLGKNVAIDPLNFHFHDRRRDL